MIENYFNDFDFGPVISVLNSFYIDINKPLHKQYRILSPDMLYLEYKNNYVIDVGWVFNDNYNKKDDGFFTVSINRKEYWDPEISFCIQDICELKPIIRYCISYISDTICEDTTR